MAKVQDTKKFMADIEPAKPHEPDIFKLDEQGETIWVTKVDVPIAVHDLTGPRFNFPQEGFETREYYWRELREGVIELVGVPEDSSQKGFMAVKEMLRSLNFSYEIPADKYAEVTE